MIKAIKQSLRHSWLHYFYRFLRIKGILHKPVMPFREFVRIPFIYDRVSFIIQMWHAKRVLSVGENPRYDDMGQPEHFTKLFNAHVRKVTGTMVMANRKAERHYAIAAMPLRPLGDEKLLSIACRSAHEILLAWSMGFSWKNITAIDLFSSHPKVQVMNMEKLEFEDASFDCVVMANALSETHDVLKAMSEADRVLKPGGRFVFNAMYEPAIVSEWPGAAYGAKEIKQILDDLGLIIYHWNTRTYKNSAGNEEADHIIGVYKPDPDEHVFDRMIL